MTTLDSSQEIQKNNPEVNETHEDFRMFGLITFLIADGMTFAGFFAAYLTYKAVNPLPDGAIYELELPIPTLNTILLLVSSATCLLYTSPSPRDYAASRMPSSA